jgi:hypothetical protein
MSPRWGLDTETDWLTDGKSVSLGVEPPSEAYDQPAQR